MARALWGDKTHAFSRRFTPGLYFVLLLLKPLLFVEMIGQTVRLLRWCLEKGVWPETVVSGTCGPQPEATEPEERLS